MAFQSNSSSLTSGQDPYSLFDIFHKDMQKGSVTLVSKTASGTPLRNAKDPFISADGRYVVFTAPGNDLVATTALAAAKCHLVLFTTGRGNPYGGYVPTIKISTNTELYDKKRKWIDFNAGKLITENITFEELTCDFIDYVISVINGEKSNNEKNKFQEIAIFKSGVTL